MSAASRAGNKQGGILFIVSTDANKEDNPETRKLIRSHVMRGKNRGKTRRGHGEGAPKSVTESTSSTSSTSSEDSETALVVSRPPIPRKVGCEMSSTRFADMIDPSAVTAVIRFSAIAKKMLYPLEEFLTHDIAEKSKVYLEALTFDAAYLHTMVFTTTYYFDIMQGKRPSEPSPHFVKAVRLLRQRLLHGTDNAKLSTMTIVVVLSLASHAQANGEYETARHHLEGLQQMVILRGGLRTFTRYIKLCLEILRFDISVALRSGQSPYFFSDPITEPYWPYPEGGWMLGSIDEPPSGTRSGYLGALSDVHDDIFDAWKAMDRFCCMINSAKETGNRLPPETLLESMTSVVYRLMGMEFEIGTVDEIIRLSLIDFASLVFLQRHRQWAFSETFMARYHDALASLPESGAHLELSLWILFISRFMVFGKPHDDWPKAVMIDNLEKLGVKTWKHMHGILKSFLWIGLLHDVPAKHLFESVFLPE